MKRVFILLVGLFAWAATSFGQTQGKDQPPNKHTPYASYGFGWTPNKDVDHSVELGTWGTTSSTTFALTFDAMKNVDKASSTKYSHWAGVKAYYTVHQEAKLCYMVYVKDAYCLDASTDNATFLEFGFNPYYTLSPHWLLGITVGSQTFQGSEWNLFSSAGLVYLRHP